MKVEKTGYVMHYSVEDEGGNIYNVTHYYNENMNLDSWEIFKDGYNSEVRHEGLRESIINSILNNPNH